MDSPFTPEQERNFFDQVWGGITGYGKESSAICPNDGYRMKASIYPTEQPRADISVYCARCGFRKLEAELDPRSESFRPWTDDEKQAMVDQAFQGQQVRCPIDGTRLRASSQGQVVSIRCCRCGNHHVGLSDQRIGSTSRPAIPATVSRNPILLPLPVRVLEVSAMSWDVFISHASEDKAEIADPLFRGLVQRGLKVWYDNAVLKLGDSLWRKINEGLSNSRYGVVILSPHFFEKEWPRKELDGLAAMETGDNKKILPVWHKVGRDDVAKFSPILADKLGVPTSKGLEVVISHVMDVFEISVSSSAVPAPTTKINTQVLPDDALMLLREAASSPTGRILAGTISMDGFDLKAGSVEFHESDDPNPRKIARYKRIINDLVAKGYIEKITPGMFELTDLAYKLLDGGLDTGAGLS